MDETVLDQINADYYAQILSYTEDHDVDDTSMTPSVLASMLESFIEDLPGDSEWDENIVSHDLMDEPGGVVTLSVKFDSGKVFCISISEDL